MLLGTAITACGILLTTFTFLLASQYMVVAFIGFTLFGIGLGFYATPSTDAALSNVPNDKAGAASGIYKMASSLGSAFGVAISAALFTALRSGDSGLVPVLSNVFLGKTSNIDIRFAAGVALLFNLFMVVIAFVAIARTVPKEDPPHWRIAGWGSRKCLNRTTSTVDSPALAAHDAPSLGPSAWPLLHRWSSRVHCVPATRKGRIER